jgi:hypothetical protein
MLFRGEKGRKELGRAGHPKVRRLLLTNRPIIGRPRWATEKTRPRRFGLRGRRQDAGDSPDRAERGLVFFAGDPFRVPSPNASEAFGLCARLWRAPGLGRATQVYRLPFNVAQRPWATARSARWSKTPFKSCKFHTRTVWSQQAAANHRASELRAMA